MSNTRYDAVAVRRYNKDGQEKSAFTTIGTAWPMRDKDGFTVRLNAIPASTEGEYVILLMPPREKQEPRSTGSYESGRGSSRQDDFGGDDIPF